jgi:hypothetical protein
MKALGPAIHTEKKAAVWIEMTGSSSVGRLETSMQMLQRRDYHEF